MSLLRGHDGLVSSKRFAGLFCITVGGVCSLVGICKGYHEAYLVAGVNYLSGCLCLGITAVEKILGNIRIGNGTQCTNNTVGD